MSSFFVRSFICSIVGPLNPNCLSQIPLYSVRALDTMSMEEGEIKGVEDGREEKGILGVKDRSVPLTSTGTAVK